MVSKISKGLDRFANVILSTKTLTGTEKIEMLRVEVSSCRSEGSRKCKLFDFGGNSCV